MLRKTLKFNRRSILRMAGTAALGTTGLTQLAIPAVGQRAPMRVGFMLPYSGTYASLSKNIDTAFRQYVAEKGGTLSGRPVEFVQVDDQAEPVKAPENMNRLIERDKVDVVVGTVHSGVQMAMVKIARETGKVLIIPNAGANAATRALCGPNIFRTSFSSWQTAFPMGKVMMDAGHRSVTTITWKYAAGEEMVSGFKEGLTKAGGAIDNEMYVPFPGVEFQSYLTQIAAKKPTAVFCFFAGGGAVKFVRDYAAFGLKSSIPLFGGGFLTDGTLPAQGEAAEGLRTTLHFADDLSHPEAIAFRASFSKRNGIEPDVYAVQGYDAAALLALGLEATRGDMSSMPALSKAMASAKIMSPRGPISFSSSRNVVQDIYLREVRKGKNVKIGVAAAALADPGTGCAV